MCALNRRIITSFGHAVHCYYIGNERAHSTTIIHTLSVQHNIYIYKPIRVDRDTIQTNSILLLLLYVYKVYGECPV